MRRFSVLALLATLLTSCSLNVNYFSDYTGTNLLSNYGFNNAGWASETLGLDNLTSTDYYMNWATAGTTGPGGGAAYKLEIKSLIPNGNFASGSLGSMWTTSSATATLTSDTTFGTSNALHFSATSTSGGLTLDIKASIASTIGTTAASHLYQFQTDLKNTSGLAFSTTYGYTIDGSSGTTTMSPNTLTPDSSTVYSFSSLSNVVSSLNAVYTSSLGAATVTFGGTNANVQEAFYLGNVRLVPDDVNLYTKLSIPSLTSTTKQLIPGSYQFTLYVKDDPNIAGTPTSNHFYAQGITVKVTAGTKNSLQQTVYATATRTSAWSSWTKLTFSLGTLDFVDSNSALTSGSTTYPALTIEISPTFMNTGTRDSGALYISDPTLTFNS